MIGCVTWQFLIELVTTPRDLDGLKQVLSNSIENLKLYLSCVDCALNYQYKLSIASDNLNVHPSGLVTVIKWQFVSDEVISP